MRGLSRKKKKCPGRLKADELAANVRRRLKKRNRKILWRRLKGRIFSKGTKTKEKKKNKRNAKKKSKNGKRKKRRTGMWKKNSRNRKRTSCWAKSFSES
jgi:tRNA A37 threonylcarbamoyladenosine dehydratase